MVRRLRSFVALAALMTLPCTAGAVSIPTTFTYQGALNEGGAPANGTFDFQFTLYDAASAGNPVGTLLVVQNVPVVNGVFTVGLNFDAGVFNDQARWLEIKVRPDGPDAYTLLTPRQPLSAGGVAQYALAGGSWRQSGDALFNTNDDKHVLINRSSRITGSEYFGVDAPTSSYGGMYINTQTGGEPFYGYASNGIERAWTYVDGSNQSWKLNVNGNDRMTVLTSGNVGIGNTAPTYPLDVLGAGQISIHAESTNPSGRGVYGKGPEGGVFGYSLGGYGVGGGTQSGFGVHGSNGGSNTTGYAGYFNGRVHVLGNLHTTGTLSKAGGTFKIDHPLDPANKTLSHSFVESPDMMNLYNGNVTTDAEGRATIEMPTWFQALNRDFRYQLTTIGSFARAMVERKMEGNRFVIRTDQPNVEVSWLVSGVRQDVWAKDNPVAVEAEKPASEKGTYLYPAGFAKVEPKAPAGAKGASQPLSANATKGGR